MTRRRRGVAPPGAPADEVDVSALPEVVFGRQAITWWATAGFMLVEGTTLAVLAVSLFYLRQDEAHWPPRPWPAPTLAIPIANLVVIVAALWPMQRAKAAAFALNARVVARWLWVATGFSLVATVLRWYEFRALQVRWDTNAYGSITWALLLAHGTLLLTDVFETGVMAVLFSGSHWEPRHFSDVEDAAAYQWFLSGSWIGLFVVLFLWPHWNR